MKKKKFIITLVGLFLFGFIYFLIKQIIIVPPPEIKPPTNSFVQKVQADINAISTSCTDFEKIKNDINSFANSGDLGTDSTENSYWRNSLIEELTINFAKRIVADSKWIFSSNSCPQDRIEQLGECIDLISTEISNYSTQYEDTLNNIDKSVTLRHDLIQTNSKCRISLILDQQISYESYPTQESKELINQVTDLEEKRGKDEYLSFCQDLGNINNESLDFIIDNHKKHIEAQIEKLRNTSRKLSIAELRLPKKAIQENIDSLNSYETPGFYTGDISTLVEVLRKELEKAIQLINNK